MHRSVSHLCAAVLAAVGLTAAVLALGRAAALPGRAGAPAPAPPSAAASIPPKAYPPEVLAAPGLPPEEYDPGYDYGAPLPLSEPVEDAWFDGAAFVGDSLTEGLFLYSGMKDTHAECLAYRGLTVQTVSTKRVFAGEGGKLTAMEALARGGYDKIFLLLGVNELGWRNDDLYFRLYSALIDQVKEAQPEADLYLQTLLPVTAGEALRDANRSNAHIGRFNDFLQELAAEKRVYLLDVHSAFAGEDGALPAEGSTDGVHLTGRYYSIWLDYLKCHTAP